VRIGVLKDSYRWWGAGNTVMNRLFLL